VPLHRQLLDSRQPQPAVLAPDLDVRLVTLVEIVPRRHGAKTAVVEAQAERGRILDVDRLPADKPGEPHPLLDAQPRNVPHTVEPVDAGPDELPAAGPLLAAQPRFAILRTFQPRLIRDKMDLDTVNLAEFPVPDEPPGLAHGGMAAIGQRHHQVTVLLLRQL